MHGGLLFVTVTVSVHCAQYRGDARQGFYRRYSEGNRTQERSTVYELYTVESAFHEMMLQACSQNNISRNGPTA